MKKSEILKQLKYFIIPHPIFAGSEEDIFTPQKGITINFWIEGGFEILAKHNKIEINFNSISTGVVVFAFREKNERIIRVLAEKIIGFELLPEKNIDKDLLNLLNLRKEQKN